MVYSVSFNSFCGNLVSNKNNKVVMTKLNWVFLISLVCALSGFVLLEEVGRTFYAGFLSICGCTIAFVTGIFSLFEREDKKL